RRSLTVGAGRHYMDRDQTQGCMTTWLGSFVITPSAPELASDFASMTVLPPRELATAVTANTVVSLTAPSNKGLSIGYHYPRVDYLITSAINVTGATLTLTNGAVLPGYAGQAIVLNSGTRLVSVGKPSALNGLGWSSGVQEMPIGGPPASATTRKLIEISSATGGWPEVRMRFTQANICADTSGRRALFTANTTSQNVSVIDLRDCQFGGVVADFSPVTYGSQSLSLVNNLWDTCTVGAYRSYAGAQQVYLRNNLFRSGSLTLYYNYFEAYGNPVWICADNMFDTTSLAGLSVATNYLVAGWNGHTAATAFFGGLGNKVGIVPVYQSGPLGPYYYPTTGGSTTLNALRNVGSQTAANASLYHHTTTADQAKETTSQVDIGFHYVATTGAGSLTLPDTDADTLPDFQEDSNGNGSANTGETAWNSADNDGDFLKDPDELMYGTRGLVIGADRDSDGDGIADLAEIVNGTDPTELIMCFNAESMVKTSRSRTARGAAAFGRSRYSCTRDRRSIWSLCWDLANCFSSTSPDSRQCPSRPRGRYWGSAEWLSFGPAGGRLERTSVRRNVVWE
ncbi:MAG TPA: hypothetical protein PLX89_27670, partial [Verrucomicrobiota bacterium]|nr:hypothetical protein [Verrucomicrobiota bacterium]